ncbi:uncharacterized protein LOC115457012 [Microcaecilia unicolor]|uniref:Uncharacterized protein LOC115457012 n=1 Tax=Microcaecilia unicolor TaxID=1415580 RepID=A0A6P7WPK3_9AMPH|nr:uncharacterized protein LOC115457012 [Microcaecilia unicolor]
MCKITEFGGGGGGGHCSQCINPLPVLLFPLSVAWAWATLTQHPPALVLEEGGIIFLSCTFNGTSQAPTSLLFRWSWKNHSFFHIWSKDDPPHSDLHALGNERISSVVDLQGKSSQLEIRGAQLKDTGVYWCQGSVLSPLPIIQLQGRGSNVTVKERNRVMAPSICPPKNETVLLAPSLLPSIVIFSSFWVIVISICLGYNR